MKPNTAILASKPERTRLAASRGGKPRVEREGGKYGAGLIRGVSIITRGEALGHRSWNDAETLRQTAEAINAKQGIKSRFTHPSMSGDGLGSILGHIVGPASIDGGRVVADLHLLQSAHSAPDGDLAGYVMDMAEESPEAFGASIVFLHDLGAEDAFTASNLKEVEVPDAKGRKTRQKVFRSPDPENVNSYPHNRLQRLLAVDAVDEPASNPGGLFSRGQEIPAEADALLAYAWGLTSERPDVAHLGVDPDRARAFMSRMMEAHKLYLAPTAGAVSSLRTGPIVTPSGHVVAPKATQITYVEAPPAKSAAQLAAERAEYERREAEKHALWTANLIAEFRAAHGLTGFASVIRMKGERPIEERALAWYHAGKPKPGAKPAASKPTGLAGAFRMAKGFSIPLTRK